MINKLFNNTDLICTGNLYTNKVEKVENHSKGEFFCINPLASVDVEHNKKEKYRYMTPRRADMNVKCFRNFMVEMDSIPLDEQLNILTNCEIPWTSIVYSGSKSYHAILSLETPLDGAHTQNGIDRYKHIWKRLEAKVNAYAGKKVIDSSSKNPSRFSRYPEYKAEGRMLQSVIHTGERISTENFNVLLSKCPEIKLATRVEKCYDDQEVESLEEFWKLCPDALAMKLKFPMNIQSEGNYHDLFRNTLWAIEATGIDKDLFIQVCEEHLFPKYAQKGYPESKWLNGIEHAYRSKGM